MDKATKNGLIISAAVIGGIFVTCCGGFLFLSDPAPNSEDLYDGSLPEYMQRDSGSQSARQPEREPKWVLRVDGNQNVPVARTEDDLQRLTQLAVANDVAGIDQMLQEGKAWNVPSGTEVTMIDRGFLRSEVRIKDGPYRGQACWVVSDYTSEE